MRVLIEGAGDDARALATLLEDEGDVVRLAGSEELGEMDWQADVAYLDPWTPETAPHAQRLRERGTRLSCLGDLLLERWEGPTVGITGTAGKTSTTALVAAILREAGIDVALSRGARAHNLWPTGDLLAEFVRPTTHRTLVLELTSSHLAFMRTSPRVAAVISFWPDHLELHGSLERYHAAKETIVRYQHAVDIAVLNLDDGSAAFAAATPAATAWISLRQPVERGAYLDPGRGLVIVEDRRETALGSVHERFPHPGNAVAAAAIASTAGAGPEAIGAALHTAAPAPWRAQPAGTLGGVPVIDDGMAATPTKTRATLVRQPDHSVLLIAGGLNNAGGTTVHSTPEEEELLDLACDEIARAARLVVLFGEAGTRLVERLGERQVEALLTPDLDAAVAAAAGRTAGMALVLFSPLFPVSLDDRARFADLVARHP